MTDLHKNLSELIRQQSRCHENEIFQIMELFEYKEYQAGEHLFKIGEKNKQIGFVCKGVLRSYNLDDDGNENTLFFSTENDFVIGNLSPRMKCSFTKQSLTETTLLVANYQDYYDIIIKNNNLLEFHENLFRTIHNKVGNRISKDFFSNSLKRYEMFLKNYPGLLNRIPHYHIANYLGITPTQLSRIRKKILN
ncbi:Crp/Fnr family transcriptional regulator [Abyssalbus ytuae]|uniref:Crp/Fnr family transcriptional regulator n=1 Tax=Abyssalbus ytuae TaxID=2926907 RepID=A0A9E7CUL3_9FLAO|nr:Crp/Fnr family transcriptional regulator [Abyssalbus ytuae]UOB18627.1 Crp/Fnr family transcriptional regulator [Abyssalbus ytuae]